MENVILDPKTKSAIATFEGFLQLSAHQQIGNAVLDMAIKNSLTKMIIDTSNLQVIRQETQKWIQEVWFPRANNSGVKYMAFVIPKDVLGKMSTTKVNEKAGNIEIQHVDSIEKAKAWISGK